ncbi:hypothetical protein D3C73_1248050 [compost metagenome]
MHLALRRFAVNSSPFSCSDSAKRNLICLSFCPFTLICSQPTMFCPISNRYLPPGIALTERGFRVFITRMFSFIWASMVPEGSCTNSAFSHLLSSKPALFQPIASFVASYSSPSYSLLALIGPSAVPFQLSSVSILAILPSL